MVDTSDPVAAATVLRLTVSDDERERDAKGRGQLLLHNSGALDLWVDASTPLEPFPRLARYNKTHQTAIR